MKISANIFYAYRIMITEEHKHLLHFGRLFQRFCSTCMKKLNKRRPLFLKMNQKKLRAEESCTFEMLY